jgi:RNA polymerase sigma-70 factor (ECF subfamily)
LRAWGRGDQRALDQLAPLVQDELKRLARRYMGREAAGHALQTTALVNEVFVRLIDGAQIEWHNRAHFFAITARMMRRILVDAARAHRYQKRGGGAPIVSLDEALTVSPERSREIVALDEALDALAKTDVRKSQVVELRYFGGLTVEETAAALGVSPDTVMRDWRLARGWLLRALTDEQSRT